MKLSWNTLILALILGASVTFAQAADYSVWRDSNYPFNQDQTIYISTMDMSNVKLNNSIKGQVLQEYYVQKSKTVKSNKIITEPIPTIDAALPTTPTSTEVTPTSTAVTERADTVIIPQSAIAANADLYVTAKVLTYKTTTYLVPAHTEWRNREVTDYYYDKYGRSHSHTHRVDYPEYIPDTYFPRAIVRVHFHMYDTKTGKLVAAIEDNRIRDKSDDATGIYKRIVDRFFKNLTT